MNEILKRKSIRNFRPEEIEKEKVDRILEAGRRAPSAKNRQQWRFIIIEDKSVREKIKNAAYGQEYFEQAPVVIAVCTTNIEYRMPNGQLSYPVDLSFAASFMILQAVHEGLGTCCVTTYDEQMVKDILTIPHAMRIVMLVVLGYTDETPEQTSRKPVKKIISYNHW